MISSLESDLKHLRHALELAQNSFGLASPNPNVGAVLVHDGQVIGEGFHTYDGLKHAEILAIERAGDKARGATLYINPTNGFGEDVTPRMPGGHELRTLYSMGPYRSAADEGKL